MDIYDPVQVQEVWRRVLRQPQTAPDEETLKRWLADEYAAAMTYRRLAARGGASAQRLWRMSRDEARHARRLSALFFLLFGVRPRVQPAATDTDRSFAAALRTAIAGETQAAREYRDAARRWPEQTSLFSALAGDEERHARWLGEMTAALLGDPNFRR